MPAIPEILGGPNGRLGWTIFREQQKHNKD